MEMVMNIARRLVTLTLPLILLLGAPAQAQESEHEVEVGTNLVCDTEAQVEMFVSLFDGDAQNAIDRVNAEVANPTACIVTTMAFYRGPKLATARHKGSSYQIAKVLVVGVVTDSGLQAVQPAAYYTLFKIDEIEV
jgi:hypothetical protein